MGHEAMTEVLQRTLREIERGRGPRLVQVRVPSGVTVEESRDLQGEVHVQLRAPDGALAVEFTPADGRCRIHAPQVEVVGDDDLRLSGRRVQIEGTHGVELRSGDARVGVEPDRVELRAEELSAVGRSVAWAAETVRVIAGVAETEAHRIAQRADELDTRAGVLVERTRQSFREAAELAQHKAERVRFVAEDTFRVLGRRALFKAREDMKLRGERIYLD